MQTSHSALDMITLSTPGDLLSIPTGTSPLDAVEAGYLPVSVREAGYRQRCMDLALELEIADLFDRGDAIVIGQAQCRTMSPDTRWEEAWLVMTSNLDPRLRAQVFDAELDRGVKRQRRPRR